MRENFFENTNTCNQDLAISYMPKYFKSKKMKNTNINKLPNIEKNLIVNYFCGNTNQETNDKIDSFKQFIKHVVSKNESNFSQNNLSGENSTILEIDHQDL